jgi:hypothetical protein
MFIALVAVPANASLIVNIGGTVSGGTVTGGTNYTDNQAGVDNNSTIGIMDIGTFLNGVSVNFVIQNFGATSGSPVASVTMNTNANLSSGATLPLFVNINISDNGFTNPLTPLKLTQTINLLSSIGGVTANAFATGYYAASNIDFDTSGPNTGAASAAVAAGVGTNVVATSGSINGAVPYSMTSAIQLAITARGGDPIQNLQMNANLSAAGQVPEPATIPLISGGLALCLIGFKKYRK